MGSGSTCVDGNAGRCSSSSRCVLETRENAESDVLIAIIPKIAVIV